LPDSSGFEVDPLTKSKMQKPKVKKCSCLIHQASSGKTVAKQRMNNGKRINLIPSPFTGEG